MMFDRRSMLRGRPPAPRFSKRMDATRECNSKPTPYPLVNVHTASNANTNHPASYSRDG
jgi:hypothetical protein